MKKITEGFTVLRCIIEDKTAPMQKSDNPGPEIPIKQYIVIENYNLSDKMIIKERKLPIVIPIIGLLLKASSACNLVLL